jgi:hypothetical protein
MKRSLTFGKQALVGKLLPLLPLLFVFPAFSQSSNVTNSAAPSSTVSAITSGGTNINYQTNNQWDNQVGFGPGIICRTPVFFAQGSNSFTNGGVYTDTTTTSNNNNASASVGLLVPFGSSSLPDCEKLAHQILTDRQISTQLSLIRACAQLAREGIKVDAKKYPLLADCANDVTGPVSQTPRSELPTPNPSGSTANYRKPPASIPLPRSQKVSP